MFLFRVLFFFGFLTSIATTGESQLLFEKAINADLKSYLSVRNEFLALGEVAKQYALDTLKRPDATWQESTFAHIVLERLSISGEEMQALFAGLGMPKLSREVPPHMAFGELTAGRFKNRPMLLAEYLWKINELVDIKIPEAEGEPFARDPLRPENANGYEYVTHAIGLIGDKRTIHVLMNVIETHSRPSVKLIAAANLRQVADLSEGKPNAEVVLDWLTRLLEKRELTQDHRLARSLLSHLSTFVNSKSSAILERAAQNTSDSGLREKYNSLIDILRVTQGQ